MSTTLANIKKHTDKIRRLKYFCDKHSQMESAFAGIRSSIWTDHEDDSALFDNMNAILMAVENKMLEREPSIHIDKLKFQFEPICDECQHENLDKMTCNIFDLMEGPSTCAECGNDLALLPEVSIK